MLPYIMQMCIAEEEAYHEIANMAIPKTSGVLQLDISSSTLRAEKLPADELMTSLTWLSYDASSGYVPTFLNFYFVIFWFYFWDFSNKTETLVASDSANRISVVAFVLKLVASRRLSFTRLILYSLFSETLSFFPAF